MNRTSCSPLAFILAGCAHGAAGQGLIEGGSAAAPPLEAAPPTAAEAAKWEVFEDQERMGYRDRTGRVRIAADFAYASSFSDGGIAWVVDDAGLRWIDPSGATLALAFNYDNGADEFNEGLTRVVDVAGKVGFMDEGGAKVIAPTWTFAAAFECGAAVVCEGCGPDSEDEHALLVGGSWGAIDRAGALVVPLAQPSWEAARQAVRDLSLADRSTCD